MSATSGDGQLAYLLPGVQTAEGQLRGYAQSRGISYKIADYGGARTETIVQQLLRWRDEAVARGEPSYRVSGFKTGKHPVGGAFDILITGTPAGMSAGDAYAVLGRKCSEYGLVWGGTFSSPADIYHFESHQTRAQLEDRWNAWVKSDDYPHGFIDAKVLIALAIVAVLLYILLHR